MTVSWKKLVSKSTLACFWILSKTVTLLRKFQNILPRPALLTLYKYFVRTHLDYGDITYDQAAILFTKNLILIIQHYLLNTILYFLLFMTLILL